MPDDPIQLDVARLRAACRTRKSFDEGFMVGRGLGYELEETTDLVKRRAQLIRRTLLEDKEPLAAVIKHGLTDDGRRFVAKFKQLPFSDDLDQPHRQDCVVTVSVIQQPPKKAVIRAIDVTVLLDGLDTVDAPEVDRHVWN